MCIVDYASTGKSIEMCSCHWQNDKKAKVDDALTSCQVHQILCSIELVTADKREIGPLEEYVVVS